MLEIIKGILLILAVIISLFSAAVMMEIIDIKNINPAFTTPQIFKQSLVAGLMFSILSLLIGVAVPFIWNASALTDFLSITPQIIVTIEIRMFPFQIIATIGTFIRLAYKQTFLRSLTKK